MKFCFLFALPVLFTGCITVTPAVKRTVTAKKTDALVWTENFRSDSVKNSYHVTLTMSNHRITGLCILKKAGEEWRGTLVNEMGAKAFDFIVTDDQCELFNVIPAMDKWYVKKTVAADLYYLFNVDNPNAAFYKQLERFEQQDNLVVKYKKKQLLVMPDGLVVLMNNRRNLRYELKKIVEIDPNKVIM
jgi:hypothetical protein